jgi:hypothetical protein
MAPQFSTFHSINYLSKSNICASHISEKLIQMENDLIMWKIDNLISILINIQSFLEYTIAKVCCLSFSCY